MEVPRKMQGWLTYEDQIDPELLEAEEPAACGLRHEKRGSSV